MSGLSDSKTKQINRQNRIASINPFDSDTELDNSEIPDLLVRTPSEPVLLSAELSTNPFDDDYCGRRTQSSTSKTEIDVYMIDCGRRTQWSTSKIENDVYMKDYFGSKRLHEQKTDEPEKYDVVYMVEETTTNVKNCVKIAEGIKEGGIKTLVNLHEQGEKITRAHVVSVKIDKQLKKGEKLLKKLGSIFSKSCKPTKTRDIIWPIITSENTSAESINHLEQPAKLGSAPKSKTYSGSCALPTEPANTEQKLELEHAKQDDALSDLSNTLVELKCMASDMGRTLDRQNIALIHFHDDVDELNSRVKQANRRGRRLLGN